MLSNRVGFVELSKLGLGTGRFASLGSGMTLSRAGLLLGTAEEAGVNLIDTADTYGSGDAERWLGRLLRGRREKFKIVTKAGLDYADLPGWMSPANQVCKKVLVRLRKRPAFSRARLRHCLERSLARLRTDRVEGFLLHEPPLSAVLDGELEGAMAEVVAEGKALQFGVSSSDVAVVVAALQMPGCAILQIPLSPVQTESSAVLAAILEAGRSVIANHIFGAGTLLPAAGSSPAEVERVKRLASEAGSSPAGLFLRYAASRPGVTAVLTGTHDPAHLRENAREIARPLAPEQAAALEVLLKSNSLIQ